jgi:hypothetical protein
MDAHPPGGDEAFPRRVLRRFEGGTLYAAERNGKFLLITDETSMIHILSEEDCAGLELVKTHSFDTEAERQAYLEYRGWLPR